MGSYRLLQITADDLLIPTTFASLKHEPRRHALNGERERERERERNDISRVRQFGYRNQPNKAVLSMNSEIGLFEQWDLQNRSTVGKRVLIFICRAKFSVSNN